MWTLKHFLVEEKLGSGYFGSVYRATYRQNDSDSKNNSSNSSNNNNEGGSSTVEEEDHDLLQCTQQVALKTFCKREVLYQLQSHGRSLELLQREVNIHSW